MDNNFENANNRGFDQFDDDSIFYFDEFQQNTNSFLEESILTIETDDEEIVDLTCQGNNTLIAKFFLFLYNEKFIYFIEQSIDQENEQQQQPSEIENNDTYLNCPICLCAWTNVGSHRLCALRCGHLFGYKCIDQWLSSKNNNNTSSSKKCPQCNSKASKNHIRYIYANKLASVDNCELEKLKKERDHVNLKYLKLSRAFRKEKRRTKKYKKLIKRLKK